MKFKESKSIYLQIEWSVRMITFKDKRLFIINAVSVILYRQGLKTGLSLCVKIYFCMKNCRSFSDK